MQPQKHKNNWNKAIWEWFRLATIIPVPPLWGLKTNIYIYIYTLNFAYIKH